MTRFLWISLFTAACMATSDVCAGELETFVVQVPDPTEPFRAEDLTPQQISLCAQFRQSAGAFRKPAFDALWQAGAFPIDQKRVSPAQVVALLGTPDRRERDRMIYSLGFDGGRGYSLDIVWVDGRAAVIGFSATL